MSNDYFKAQGWFKNYALNSQDSRGTFQQLVKEDEEAFRLASAESDRIKNMMNKKYGPGTMKYGSEISQPTTRPDVIEIDAINSFIRRNPAAEGGRMLNAVQMGEAMGNRTGFATPKGTGIPLSKEQLQLLKDNLTKEEFKKLKFGQPLKADVLDIGVRQRGDKPLWRKVTNILEPGKASSAVKIINNEKLSNALIKSTNAGDDLQTIITKMNKLDKSLNKNQISSAINALIQRGSIAKEFGVTTGGAAKYGYRTGELEEINKIIEEAVNEKKSNRAQIARKAGVADSVVEDWIRENKGDDFYEKNFDYETGRLKTGDLQTRKDLFEFVENSDNVTAKEIAKNFNLDSKKTQKVMADLVSDIYRVTGSKQTGSIIVPYDEPDRMKTVLDKIRNAPDFEDIYERRIETLVTEAYPTGSKAQAQAKKSLSEYRKFAKSLKAEFPELALALDHVVPFQFLKEVKQGKNPINLIRVKPTISAVNRFKTNFDNAKIELNRLNKIDPNNPDIKKRLKILTDLQNNIGIEFGGTSKGGYVYNFGAKPIGKSDLIGDAKKIISDYQKVGDFSEKVLADKNLQKQLIEAGVDTGKDMSSFKKIKPFDKDQLKKIEAYITDTTGKVKQPMFSSGFSGAFEMLSDDLKPVLNNPKFKAFAKTVVNTPGKFFGIGDVVLGYLDYENNLGKYGDDEKGKALSLEYAKQAMSFGLWKTGDKEYLKQLKNTYIKNGGDESVFDQVISLNKQNSELMNLVEKTKEQYQTELENEKTYGTAGGPQAIKFQLDVPSASNTLKNNLSAIKTKAENMDKDFTTFTETYKGTDLTQPSKDIKAAAFEDLTAQKRKVFDTQSRQVNTEAGPIGNKLFNSIFTKDSYKKLLPQNLPSTLNQMIPFMSYKPVTEKEKEQAYINEMAKNYPQELYRYNLERGVDPDNPVTFDATSNLISKPELGFNFSEGGITSLRSKYEYKK